METTRTAEPIKSEYTTKRIATHEGSLIECYDDYLLGEVNGLDIYVGISFGNNIDPTRKDNAPLFADYSTKEMKGYQTYWNSWSANAGKEQHKKVTKPEWGFGKVNLYAFANGIQIGDPIDAPLPVELGYTPKANFLDLGELVWVTPDQAIAEWEIANQDFIENFADTKRLEALTLFAESLEKLTK